MPIKIVPKEDKKTYDEARSKFLKDYVPESADGSPTPQKYLDYADQEGKEAVEKSKKRQKSGRHRKNEGWRFSKVFSLQAG
jgi:hypothetical protein